LNLSSARAALRFSRSSFLELHGVDDFHERRHHFFINFRVLRGLLHGSSNVSLNGARAASRVFSLVSGSSFNERRTSSTLLSGTLGAFAD